MAAMASRHSVACAGIAAVGLLLPAPAACAEDPSEDNDRTPVAPCRAEAKGTSVAQDLERATCLEQYGRVASAWSMLHTLANRLVGEGRTAEASAIRERAAALAPMLARMVVTVLAWELRPPGLLVRRDGIVVGPAAWGIPLPVDPGKHEIGASAPGREPWLQTIEVAAGATVEVRVPALAMHSEPNEGVDGAESSRTLPRTLPSRTKAAIGIGSVGLVGLAAGAVFGALALVEKRAWEQETQQHCDAHGTCDTLASVRRIQSIEGHRRIDSVVANIGLVGGGAAIAGAALLWGLALRPPREGTRLGVWLGPEIAGAELEIRF